MAVIPMWQCDRDGSMFADKKAAEEYDRQLELAANLSSLLGKSFTSLDEELAESIGLLLARHKETVVKAFRGKPELLLELLDETVSEPATEPD
ncbi:MAG: YebG family protein [Endozoicomonadaceae bacterium]|nr:YebG family protein [Endozoicomonadaceae bacterium]